MVEGFAVEFIIVLFSLNVCLESIGLCWFCCVFVGSVFSSEYRNMRSMSWGEGIIEFFVILML